MKNLFKISPFLFIFLFSCKKDVQPINMGYHYFPLNEGLYRIYEVRDIFHDTLLNPKHDTSYYQIKEVVGEAFQDDMGDDANKLYRYFRINDTLNWQIKDVWAVKRTKNSAELFEENKRRIKMGFAISYHQFWDYNAYNSDSKTESYYRNIAEPTALNALSFDSTTVVEHLNYKTFVDYRRLYEIYAANVGLIYSVNKNLQISNNDTLNIIKGTEIQYEIIEFGTE